MKHEEFEWLTNDGLKLYAQKWEPSAGLKGTLCLVHGLGEHSSRYRHWAEKLTDAGYALFAFDLRGHGRSAGKRGHAPSFDHHAGDINQLLEQAASFYEGLPLFIYGHSLGGLLVLYLLISQQPQLNGAVVTSPGLETVAGSRKFMVAAAGLLGRLIPSASIANGLELEGLSRDGAVIEAYINDPLVHNRITFGMGKDMFAASDYVFKNASSINLPLLLMHGSADRLTFAGGSQKIAESVSDNCTLKIWDGFYHELHNEPEQNEVFAYLNNWLDQHLESSKS